MFTTNFGNLAERSMSDAWRTHSWHARHFAEMLGFIEVNVYKSLKYFKKGPWETMSHNEFRRRLSHAFMTLGKEPFPDDEVAEASVRGANDNFTIKIRKTSNCPNR